MTDKLLNFNPQFFVVLSLLLFWSACTDRHAYSPEVAARLPEVIDYNYHVKPILSDRCYTCHGPDENARKANLRLDIKEGAYGSMYEGQTKAIVPYKISKSAMYHHIWSDDSTQLMPPPESNLRLSDYEKAILTKWIEQGAAWKRHWAFIPLEQISVPEVSNQDWPNNPIDHFIGKKLEKNNMQPAPEARKELLIRRLYLDLTGLPPTVEQIDAFLNNDSPDAYEKPH